jgi:methyl-accepting chemotaxis protein
LRQAHGDRAPRFGWRSPAAHGRDRQVLFGFLGGPSDFGPRTEIRRTLLIQRGDILLSTSKSAPGYFTFHGVWAPGVRAFRSLHFRAKALLISAVFLAPMALLGVLFVQARMEVIEVARLERQGVAYVKEAAQLVTKAAAQSRLALRDAVKQPAPELGEARKALEAQLDVVAALDKSMAGSLGTSAALTKVRAAVNGLAPGADGLAKVYASNVKLSLALYELLGTAADGSGLTLDPELDTYYLMNSSVMVLPRLLDEIARMRGLAAAVALSGQDGAMADIELQRLDAVAAERGDIVIADAAKVMAAQPQAKGKIDPAAAIKAASQLRELATDEPGQGGAAKADKLTAQGSKAVAALAEVQGAMIAMLDDLLAARIERNQRSMATVGAVIGAFLLLAAYLFYSFYLVMNGGLKEMRHHVDLMAEGDLTSSPKPWGSDESAELMLALHAMQASLRDIVGQVRGSSEQIASASSQIAQGAGDMSTRTEQAAASLQQTSASMTDISSTVSRTAEVVDEAASLANNNAQVAGEGGHIISSMVQTMDQINTSSRRITDILGVIDGIAFQTNILALNAAVEAARAGEQGRGFAVVASEVRSLAQRSAAAAREIKSLIGTNVEKVDAGAHEVRRAGETMTTIVGNAERIRALLDEISTGARQQSQGLAGIGGSVKELDDSVQQNAALTEETAAAANSLSDQAHVLVGKVARFKLPAMA